MNSTDGGQTSSREVGSGRTRSSPVGAMRAADGPRKPMSTYRSSRPSIHQPARRLCLLVLAPKLEGFPLELQPRHFGIDDVEQVPPQPPAPAVGLRKKSSRSGFRPQRPFGSGLTDSVVTQLPLRWRLSLIAALRQRLADYVLEPFHCSLDLQPLRLAGDNNQTSTFSPCFSSFSCSDTVAPCASLLPFSPHIGGRRLKFPNWQGAGHKATPDRQTTTQRSLYSPSD